MTVTIEVAGGPSVRLTYHGGYPGGRDGGPIVPYMSVTVGEQARTRGPGYLYDLLSYAGALLLLYAADQDHWPADLWTAGEQPPGAAT
jgi:hypothetical protein